MMRLALAVVLAGCATQSSVSVRMARPDDHVTASCIPGRGAAASELFRPIARFARAELVSREARRARFVRDVHFISGHRYRGSPAPRDGILITVDPRDAIGWIVVANFIDGWSTGTTYCTDVMRDGRGTTVLVREYGVWVH